MFYRKRAENMHKAVPLMNTNTATITADCRSPQSASSHEAMADYWDGLGIQELLPELSFERDVSVPTAQNGGVCGRRVVSVGHFMKAAQELGEHRCPFPGGGHFEFEEERRIGLWSEFKFQCSGCHEVTKVTTDPVAEPTPLAQKAALGVNDATVWAFTSIGSGHSHLEEALSVMEIPVMCKKTFLRREEALGKASALACFQVLFLPSLSSVFVYLMIPNICWANSCYVRLRSVRTSG